MRRFTIAIILITFSLQSAFAWRRSMNEAGSQLIIVYDNNTLKKGLTSSWGFSCLIILPQYRILFDTGGDPSILLKNMDRMDIDPEKIDSVVLSHGHADHTGGLIGLLQYHNDVTVYLPKSFPKMFKKEVDSIGARIEEVGGSIMIHPSVYTTGELGKSIKEQSLVLKTRKGLVIITGCAHPGIVEIVEHVRKLFKDKVYLLIGGFHLMGKSPKEIKGIAKKLDELNVEKIAPCHCSGDTARDIFKQYYGDNYITCATGLVMETPHLK
ncbi:MAG: MBL fold metallo-hydrolase [Desulfobacteraceae bacterium]|nr:MBL fold metallo-hydrolase [Desulfobacteraceae bacterium]